VLKIFATTSNFYILQLYNLQAEQFRKQQNIAYMRFYKDTYTMLNLILSYNIYTLDIILCL